MNRTHWMLVALLTLAFPNSVAFAKGPRELNARQLKRTLAKYGDGLKLELRPGEQAQLTRTYRGGLFGMGRLKTEIVTLTAANQRGPLAALRRFVGLDMDGIRAVKSVGPAQSTSGETPTVGGTARVMSSSVAPASGRGLSDPRVRITNRGVEPIETLGRSANPQFAATGTASAQPPAHYSAREGEAWRKAYDNGKRGRILARVVANDAPRAQASAIAAAAQAGNAAGLRAAAER